MRKCSKFFEFSSFIFFNVSNTLCIEDRLCQRSECICVCVWFICYAQWLELRVNCTLLRTGSILIVDDSKYEEMIQHSFYLKRYCITGVCVCLSLSRCFHRSSAPALFLNYTLFQIGGILLFIWCSLNAVWHRKHLIAVWSIGIDKRSEVTWREEKKRKTLKLAPQTNGSYRVYIHILR